MLLVRHESENNEREVKGQDRVEIVANVSQLAEIDIKSDTEGLILNRLELYNNSARGHVVEGLRENRA